jgi:hypothetical protein
VADVGSHPDKSDFAEFDMGGGLRMPIIKVGPQYYLRTCPSKQFYLSQAAIDLLHPEPESDGDSEQSESDSDSEEGSESD